MENIHEIIDNIIIENNNGEITAKALNLLLHEIANSSSAVYIKMPDSLVIRETDWGEMVFLQIKDNSIIEHNKNVYDQIINAFDDNKIPEVNLMISGHDGYIKKCWMSPEFGFEKVLTCYKCLLTEELASDLDFEDNDYFKLEHHIGEYILMIECWYATFVLFSNGDMTLNASEEYIEDYLS